MPKKNKAVSLVPMANMIMIETATDVCSVALVIDDEIKCVQENREGRTHAAEAAVFVDLVLKKEKMEVSQLDAIVVSSGPGSYTGLRIGVSLAKGLCYGANIKLIAISTLTSMAASLAVRKDIPQAHLLCPMLDARRMEVYAAVFTTNMDTVQETEAIILDENTFEKHLSNHKLVIFGSGAEKTKQIIQHSNAIFIDNFQLSAASMLQPALEKLRAGDFEDVAYFEPFYLKEFMTTTSKKNILGL